MRPVEGDAGDRFHQFKGNGVRRHRGQEHVTGGFHDHVGVEQQVMAGFARAFFRIGTQRDGDGVHDRKHDAASACGGGRHRRREQQVKAGVNVAKAQGGAAEGTDHQVGDAFAEAGGDEGGAHREGSEDQPGGTGFVAIQYVVFFEGQFGAVCQCLCGRRADNDGSQRHSGKQDDRQREGLEHDGKDGADIYAEEVPAEDGQAFRRGEDVGQDGTRQDDGVVDEFFGIHAVPFWLCIRGTAGMPLGLSAV